MRLFLLFFSIVCFASCNTDEDVQSFVDFQYEYIPLEEGTESLFRMDSVVFNIEETGQVRDTTEYYLKEVQSEWIELEGRTFMAVDQYKADSPDGPWDFYQRVFDLRGQSAYSRTESNLELVLFAFPPALGKSWEATSLINNSVNIPIGKNYMRIFDKWDESYMINFMDSMLVNGVYMDSVFHIEYVDKESLVDIRFEEHFYAKGQGLIMRNVRMLDSQDESLIIPLFEDYAEAGYLLQQVKLP